MRIKIRLPLFIESHRAGEELLFKKFEQYTMVPQKVFSDNLLLLDRISNVSGSIVECGVWRGGMIASIGEMLGNDRKYYLFDSFKGLPEVGEIDGYRARKWQNEINSPTYWDNCKAEKEYAISALKMAGIKNYEVIEGWFEETLPKFALEEKIALLRLDADWFESTLVCLSYLYPLLNDKGLVIVDDYYQWDGCAKAVHKYFGDNMISDRIRSTQNSVCFIIKNEYN